MDMDENQMNLESSQSEGILDSTDQSGMMLFSSKVDDSDSADEESETYYFESDHIALKGNHDYQMMLRTIAVLEAQRIQAVKDLDKLYEQQQEALKDPIKFVDKLQRGIDLGLPKPQKIVDLPDIHWEQYTSNLDFSSFGTHRHMTRLKRQLVDGNTSTEEVKPCLKNESGEMIRGRIKTDKKPQTFNQLWTAEEQKRLEDLLITYPPEEVEARRFQKIAAALGNRTPIQVQSRVQKYFIKLAKAGLPIPGRAPNIGIYKKKSQRNSSLRYQRFTTPSTFLTSVAPPVYMSDDDENSQGFEGSIVSNNEPWDKEDSVSDDESIPLELRGTPEYQELLALKRMKRDKYGVQSSSYEHIGFKCDRCDIEPIVGTRWHCTDCPPDIAVDFCEDCVDCSYETETHNSSHRLKPKHKADNSTYMDTDYMSFIPGGNYSGYNYLDPNYMPAS